MKNSLLTIATIVLLAMSLACERNQDVNQRVAAQLLDVDLKAQTQPEPAAQGVVPSDIGLYDIVLQPDRHTWKDLDAFYRNVVLSKADEHYFTNLKRMTIWNMVELFNMPEHADLLTVDFYVDQQADIDLIDPGVYTKCMKRIIKDGGNPTITKLTCQYKYKQAKQYIIERWGESVWEQEFREKFDELDQFQKSLQDRWGSR